MASVGALPPIVNEKLFRMEYNLGCCLSCREGVHFRDQQLDYVWMRSIGIVCKCGSAMLVEYKNPICEERHVDASMAARWYVIRFRLHMLAWQWQTGRTLSGYWRR